jgi:hypothetical protein
MRNWNRIFFAVLVLPILGLALTNCGGSSSGTATIVATITPTAGGVIEFTDENGATINIDFPAGALSQNVDIMLGANPEPSSSWLNVTFDPPGLSLQVPATITVIVPDGVSITSDTTLLYGSEDEPLPLPTTVDLAMRTLTAQVNSLGYAAASTARTSTSSSGFITRNTRNHGGNVHTVTVADLPCNDIKNIASNEFDVFHVTGSHTDAKQVYGTYQTLKQKEGCGTEVADYHNYIIDRACQKYNDAKSALQKATIQNFGDFETHVLPFIDWASEVFAVGGTCAHDFQSVIDDEIEFFFVFYEDKLNNDPGTNENFYALRNEIKEFYFELYEEMLVLGYQARAEELLERLIQAMAAKLRTKAFELAQDTKKVHLLSRVTPNGIILPPQDFFGSEPPDHAVALKLGYEPEDIFQDINMVNARVSVSVTDLGNEVSTTQLGQTSGGAGSHVATGEISISQATVDGNSGFLEIAGTLLQLECKGAATFDDMHDEIEVYLLHGFNGRNLVETFVAPAGFNNHLQNVIKIDIDEMFSNNGITFDPAKEYTLEIMRTRPRGSFNSPSCDYELLFGPQETRLFTVSLNGECRRRGTCDCVQDEKWDKDNTGEFTSNTNIEQPDLLARLGDAKEGQAVMKLDGLCADTEYVISIRGRTDEADGAPGNILVMRIGTASMILLQSQGAGVERIVQGLATTNENGELFANISASGGSGVMTDHCFIIDVNATIVE